MGETDMSITYYNRDRRRSSFTRPMRDPEEILEGLRSLKAAKGELSRTMSLSGDKRRGSREYKRFFRLSRPSSRSYVSSCLVSSVRLSLSLYFSIRSRQTHIHTHLSFSPSSFSQNHIYCYYIYIFSDIFSFSFIVTVSCLTSRHPR